MAMANNKTQCSTCNKEKITYPCKGCSKEFCLMDLTEHKQILSDELNLITNEYNEFKQRINEQKQNPQNDLLIKQIDEWEANSIDIIQQKAQQCRKIAMGCLPTFLTDIEKKFNDLSEQIKQIHHENDFNEINLIYLRNQLLKITQELNNPSKISIQHDSQSFINEISIISSRESKFNKWKQNAIIVAGGNGQEQQLNQLFFPYGIFVDKKKNIFIADYGNKRIVEWKYNAKEGQIIAGGNRKDQLYRPIEYNNEGVVVTGGNGKGNQLNQLNDPTSIFVDEDQSVYVSDHDNNRVMKWRKDAKEGTIVAGGNGQGRNLNQLHYPEGLFVDDLGQIYVADCWNHRVMHWCEGKEEGEIVVGGNGEGNQLNHPSGLYFDDERNLYVADRDNHRIQKFEIVL
ncbi:unnamed protein product [Adineta steineri]|uniref:Uncharacterized protein n=1 Tax=Adineta steineri TaxID=433720 RepID=A0A814T919_9BILA|nr:unnamed protein product [Adineta steineri]